MKWLSADQLKMQAEITTRGLENMKIFILVSKNKILFENMLDQPNSLMFTYITFMWQKLAGRLKSGYCL